MDSNRTCLTIILAAGTGSRMKSAFPKVLRKVGGLEMLGHVVQAASAAGSEALSLVVGPHACKVRLAAERLLEGRPWDMFVQERQLGTAHAVLAAREAMMRGSTDVLILYGDVPLIEVETLAAMRSALAEGAQVVVTGFWTDQPAGLGRIIENNGSPIAIKEERDCSEHERRITYCNSGAMALAGDKAMALLEQVGNMNAQGEYYLTDLVAIAAEEGLAVRAIDVSPETAIGVNDCLELAKAEAFWQARKRREIMLSGVTLMAPETVFFSYDTEIGSGTVVEPNVWFGPDVQIAAEARIKAFSYIEGARVGSGSIIGPFIRLRPGTQIMQEVQIGTFCELKQARIETGVKMSHLSYIGDAWIGPNANIGGGTITCNYDGFSKNHTEIGERAFIGAHSSLIAPISIGAGAYVASGSALTQDVPENALVFARARQKAYEGRAQSLRERLEQRKKDRGKSEDQPSEF